MQERKLLDSLPMELLCSSARGTIPAWRTHCKIPTGWFCPSWLANQSAYPKMVRNSDSPCWTGWDTVCGRLNSSSLLTLNNSSTILMSSLCSTHLLSAHVHEAEPDWLIMCFFFFSFKLPEFSALNAPCKVMQILACICHTLVCNLRTVTTLLRQAVVEACISNRPNAVIVCEIHSGK